MGFEPRIIPAIYVQPFSTGQKNDDNDAEAITEAVLRLNLWPNLWLKLPPNLRTVAKKSQDQLGLWALQRGRAPLEQRRTATINPIRAFLIEQGR